MLFQTLEFAVLMISVLAAMVLARTHMLQMILLLIASWIFYMWWNPIFLVLLLYSTVNDYLIGLAMERSRTSRARRVWLVVSVATNLGVLAIFKYFNFFIDSVNQVSAAFGGASLLPYAHITLPVGISFYTFQSMSYTIDVFRRALPAERSFIRFALYVAFFPQLVAGPILRSTQFLPQLYEIVHLRADNLRSGLNLMLVGLVKKVLVADNVAPLANHVFDDPQGLPSVLIVLGTLAFGIQIYCDFSGYTDMARGAGRMLGFDILLNFNFPYFARTITDFWRRWHMSLSYWLRDYLYIPLGGNRFGTFLTYRNLMLTMGLGGLWHGAGWNFVAWGVYQGLLLSLERLLNIAAGTPGKDAPKRAGLAVALRAVVAWIVCQYFVFLGWVLFRVHNAEDLIYCVRKYVLFDFDFSVAGLGLGNVNPFYVIGVMTAFAVIHFISFRIGSLAGLLDRIPKLAQWLVLAVTVSGLIWFWPQEQQAFIYFQF